MKKTVCIILIVGMLFTLCSCGIAGKKQGEADNLQDQTGQIDNPQDEIKPSQNEKEYKVYCDGGIKGSDDVSDGKRKDFYDAKELKIDVARADLYKTEDSVSTVKTLMMDNTQWTLSYERTRQTLLANSKTQHLQALGHQDCYAFKDENVSITAEFDSITGKLRFWLCSERNPEAGEFTVEQAKEKAVAFIEGEYGSDALNGFVLTQAEKGTVAGKEKITIQYKRYVAGYESAEYVQVRFNLKGDIVGVNASTLGLFDFEDLDQVKIDNAKNELISRLGEDAQVKNQCVLCVNATDGAVYLEMIADGALYYINVV